MNATEDSPHLPSRRSSLRILSAAAVAAAAGLFSADAAHAAVAVDWGFNNNGALGDGTTTNRPTPTLIKGPPGSASSVAAGYSHGLAVVNGAVYAWGLNFQGEVGDDSTTNRLSPVAVPTLASNVTAVAGGAFHSLAIRSGAAYAWGAGNWGNLGNGLNDQHIPVPCTVLTSGVTAIAAGNLHSLAIRNGALYAWGGDTSGQLGDGGSTLSSTPHVIPGLSANITAIAAGNYHSLVVQNSALYVFGKNSSGQLGDGSISDRHTPFAVPGLSDGVTAVAGGNGHSLAVRNGQVYAWGYNYYGSVGNGSTDSIVATPQLIDPGNLHDIVAVAAGLNASYALPADGSLWVWGDDGVGQLGIGYATTTPFRTPQHLLPPTGYVFTSIDGDANGSSVMATLGPKTYFGDANLDGKVNALDFNALAKNFGASGKNWIDADFNYDGTVNTQDFALIAANFGLSAPAASPSALSAVPEPACACSMIAGGILITLRRRT